MRVDDAWTVASKDLRAAWQRKGIRYGLGVFPLLSAASLPLVVRLVVTQRPDLTPAAVEELLRSFLFFFMIAVSSLPTAIASYALIGEKVERSLEPMLATPVSVGSVLVGKMIAAVVPTLVAVWTAAAVFMVLANREAAPILGHGYFPQAVTWVQLLILMPAAALMTVNLDILVSARVSDVRSAQQIAGLVVLPVSGLYVAAQLGSLALDMGVLLGMSVVVLAIDVVTLWAARRVFDREEILTRWG